jgi:hypothetical protein
MSRIRKGGPGTVSHGTMREEHLIPAFMHALEYCNPAKAKKYRKDPDNRAIFRWLDAGAPSYSYKSKAGQDFAEKVSYFLNEDLFEALDECAPKGHYFGSHPGDGSDYGFWKYEGDE